MIDHSTVGHTIVSHTVATSCLRIASIYSLRPFLSQLTFTVKMPAPSSGRVSKARKHGTPHQKNHRWESFSSKISKLNSLDPLRKVRRHDLEDEDLSATTSYLRNGLVKWSDLNISKSFTDFKREIMPLCETLPQILHFQDKIMDLLAQYLSAQDKEALEPLLDLLTAFAHDLGPRFEQYYQRSLELLVAIASKPQDVDVIEWTFGAFAWLFKYLSKLLVPNLPPTYDMLAGLLGKQKHPVHINRFAAEAMSFLIKKAAAPSNRQISLPQIIAHVRDDLQDLARVLAQKNQGHEGEVAEHEMEAAYKTKQFEAYREGIMTMFSEAMKGPGSTLHSTAAFLFDALLDSVPSTELEVANLTCWTSVCCGVLTSVIHHSNADFFQVLSESILAAASRRMKSEGQGNPYGLSLFTRLLGIMAGVRSGSRLSDWRPVVKTLTEILQMLSEDADNISRYPGSKVWDTVVANAAICWTLSPMDALMPSLNEFNRAMTREPLMKWYIPFCGYLAEVNGARFRSLFQKPFQKFVVAHWSETGNEELLCVLLPKLVTCGAIPAGGNKDGFLLPQSWQDQIVTEFEELGNTPFPETNSQSKNPDVWRDHCLPKYNALLKVLESTNVHPSTNARIAELLLKKLKLALRPSESLATEETRFIVTQGFLGYLRMSKVSGSVDGSLSPLLKAAAPRFSRSPAFLQALLGYEKEMAQQKPSDKETLLVEEHPFLQSLVNNLANSSRPLRTASLKVFEVLPSTPDQESCLDTMISVEELPLDHNSPRAIAIHLRRLAKSYPHLDEKSWLRHAIPAFLFGQLTVRLAPVWDDAAEALKQIAEDNSAADVVFKRAFEWLQVPSPRWTPPQVLSNPARMSASDFECSNLDSLREQAREIGEAIDAPSSFLLRNFEGEQDVPPDHVANARSKALKVLSSIPSTAERRSRKIVPFLLSLDDAQVPSSEDEDEDRLLPEADFWSLPDRKALIGVFAQFGNPKVLYRSSDVYNTLLSLVANREIEVQKLALKAILAWKQEGVKPYRENLENLLDDARFKNELTVFLQDDELIRDEHRAELMPVLLRILYGRATAKKGAASGRNGLHATRLAVIRNLSLEDVGGFLDIALGNLRDIRVVDASGLRQSLLQEERIAARKMVGLLHMIDSVINELGASVERYMDPLVNAVLYCLFSASRNLQQAERNDEEAADDDASVDDNKAANTSLFRVARTTSLKCLCALVRNNSNFNWAIYQEAIVTEIVAPAVTQPVGEMAQGVSWTWKLLDTWSLAPQTALALAINDAVVPKIADCIGFEKSKNEVRIFALGIVRNLVKAAQAPESGSEFDGLVVEQVLDPNADKILGVIGSYLHAAHDIENRVLEACIDTVVELSAVVDGSTNARSLVDISTHLLNQPARRVSPKIKGSLLLILERYVVVDDIHSDPTLKKSVLKTLSSLFSFFKDKRNRESLSKVLLAYATRDHTVQDVAQISADLNSYVAETLDEPDYDRRLAAFNAINKGETVFTIEQWLPLLHNAIFFLNHDEEFGILASNSADMLCRLVDAAAGAWNTEMQPAYVDLLNDSIMPAIHAGVRESSETVRRETVRLLSHVVSKLGTWSLVSDLSVLLPTNEEEANKAFFVNILTPSVSKQVQAVQTLSLVNERNELGSKNISQILLPLLEHFIWGRAGADDHGLGAQAAATIASLAGSLEWPQYRATLRRYISYLTSKPELHKQVIRLLDKVVDALVSAAEIADDSKMEVDGAEVTKRRLARSLPSREKMAEEFTTNFTPPLLEHLKDKDEETVSARVPVAVILVKLLRLLPDEILSLQLPSVLTDLCHILRSKAVEARDMARGTLAKIACILGPPSFGFILKELRGALKMGTHLHVLSYTMHTLLLAVTPEFQQGDLDYCLDSMVAVIMDDIFGVSGQEKDAEGYVSKWKEVKSSKSQDSMELIASSASITHLVELVKPLQAMLLEKLDVRTARKIDELLNRIASGLQKNPASDSQDTLVFCYEVIQEVYNSRKPTAEKKIDPRLKRYLIQRGAKREDRGAASKHTHKLMRFAIDILRSVLKKREALRSAGNINGFIPILGDAIVAGEEEVKIAAFKLLTVLIKVPSKTNELNDLYKVASKDALKSISQSVSTSTDLAQTALKLLSVILRDRREIVVKDAAIDMLLGKLKDDLTEPLYRHVTFKFLRSILDRKIETAAVYDTLDYVGTVMITNDDKDTRDLARGAFFQFLREYPQKKSRWQKQVDFIIANLKYPREGGRISVMEVLHLLLTKSAPDFVREIAASCFFPLVLVVGNDESEKCQLVASVLIKEIFSKAEPAHLKEFLDRMRAWVKAHDNPSMLKLGFQIWSLYFEAMEPSEKDKKDVKLLTGSLLAVFSEKDKEDWELINSALDLVRVLVERNPDRMLSTASEELWASIFPCMSHERPAVKLNAVRLLATYLADFAGSTAALTKGQSVVGTNGQKIQQEKIWEIIRLLLGTLRGLEVDEELARESVQILVPLTRFLSNAAAEDDGEASDEEDGQDEDEDDFFKDGEEKEEVKKPGTMTMRYVFTRLAEVIRRETRPRAPTLVSKLAAAEALYVLCARNDAATLEPSLRTILRPLRNLTDPNIPMPFSTDELFKTRHETLKTKAQQIMDGLQEKLGTAEYTKQLLVVGEEIKGRRMHRSSKRKVEAITAPEKWGKEKKRKLESKKNRRKAIGLEHRSKRRGY
jgi:U3 small nucleolar RNA-associated protein 20